MKLIAFSGKKQSGKDSTAKFLIHNANVLFGSDRAEGVKLPVYTKVYYFGGPMKDFAVKYLGVEPHKVWGTDEQKNELTHIRWESLPHYLRIYQKINVKPTGFMTGRQLLQQIGEDMFLEMYPAIWVSRFENILNAEKDNYDVGLVPDPRKPEQIDCIHRLGGKVIRLLRDPYRGTDRHISETALDPDFYDQSNFDAVIDNRNMGIIETRIRVVRALISLGVVPLKKYLPIQWTLPEEQQAA